MKRETDGAGEHGIVLDLECPWRARVFYLAIGVPLTALSLYFLIGGPGRHQRLIGATLAACFIAGTVQGVQGRIQVQNGQIRKRYFGVWKTQPIPAGATFRSADDQNYYAGAGRALLNAPREIALVDVSSGREITRISCDLLAGMADHDYGELLRRLNRAA